MSLSLALLHAGAQISPTACSVHPSTIVGIIGLAALYERGARSANGAPRLAQRWYFYGALVVLFLSLNGWLHDLSDSYLFSAHMVQHMLLIFAMPPLLLYGIPGYMLKPLLDNALVLQIGRRLTRPTSAFAIFNVTLVAWHSGDKPCHDARKVMSKLRKINSIPSAPVIGAKITLPLPLRFRAIRRARASTKRP